MNNKEILENAPEGWTHILNGKYCRYVDHEEDFKWFEFCEGGWFSDYWTCFIFEDDIRSRADIERIVELESNYNEARRICKEVCFALGHDAEFPAFCDMQSIVETMVRDNETYQLGTERTTKNKETK